MTMGGADSQLMVLKVGGSVVQGLAPSWWDSVAAVGRGRRLVCVHGWSRPLACLQQRDGREPRILVDKHGHRSRFTDELVLADILAVSERLRAAIGAELRARGLRVASVVAADAAMLHAEVRTNLWWVGAELKALDSRVGPITRVDPEPIRRALEEHDALVVTPLARSPRHPLVNVDGDRAAARIAAALGARDLVFMTDVPALLVEGRPCRLLRGDEVPAAARSASGGMVKKLLAARQALEAGVGRAAIGNGSIADLLAGRRGTAVVAA